MNLPAFTEAGQGDTAVLLLHGIGGGRTLWTAAGSATVEAIAALGFRALAIDLPGYGGSLALGPPSMDAFVAALGALVSAIAAPRVVLVGHSMGGMVAQELVARDPRRVQGLVLACTSAAFGAAGGAWQSRFVAERLAPLDQGLGMAGMAAKLVPAMVSPRAAPDAVRIATGVMAAVPEPSYRAALQSIVGFDRRTALAAIGVPTLVLAGDDDATAPAALMRRMAERIPGAAFASLAGAGHIANLEQPAAFNAALGAFLQQHFDGA